VLRPLQPPLRFNAKSRFAIIGGAPNEPKCRWSHPGTTLTRRFPTLFLQGVGINDALFAFDPDLLLSIISAGAKRGNSMSKSANIDFARLLGFETVSDHLSGTIDFKDETIGASLGAKVGQPEAIAPADALDHSKLLGFETVSHELAVSVDFKNETIGDKLGAKIGFEPGAPEKG